MKIIPLEEKHFQEEVLESEKPVLVDFFADWCHNCEEFIAVMEALAEEMTDDDSGIISVYYGSDVDADTAQTLADSLAEKYPELDVSLNFGGQPVYCYIISVE